MLGYRNNIGANNFIRDDHDSILILSNDTILTKNSLNLLKKTLYSKKYWCCRSCIPYYDNR